MHPIINSKVNYVVDTVINGIAERHLATSGKFIALQLYFIIFPQNNISIQKKCEYKDIEDIEIDLKSDLNSNINLPLACLNN